MTAQIYDIITVGGGIAGSILAKTMAEHGAKVLVLESETNFRDRVRGEAIAPWSTKEATELGIYDALMAAGGHHLRYWYTYQGPDAMEPRDLEATTVTAPGSFVLVKSDISTSLYKTTLQLFSGRSAFFFSVQPFNKLGVKDAA